MGKNELICEIVKEKEIGASFAVALQTAKVTATVHRKCSVEMEKAFVGERHERIMCCDQK